VVWAPAASTSMSPEKQPGAQPSSFDVGRQLTSDDYKDWMDFHPIMTTGVVWEVNATGKPLLLAFV
jgi:hypothetical protein